MYDRRWALATAILCSSIGMLFDELRAAPLDGGARVVVHAHADQVTDVLVDDEGCLVDVDTPADYDALIKNSRT